MNKQADINDDLDVGNDSELLPTQAPPYLKCNLDDYRQDIEAFDLTKEQQDEFLLALWDILCRIVDLGWGVDSVQILLPEIFEKAGQDSVNLLEKKDSENQLKNAAQSSVESVHRKEKP